MGLDNSDLALSLLSIVRTAVWLVLIAELLADRQAKHIGRRSAAKADRRTLETAEECRLPDAGRV